MIWCIQLATGAGLFLLPFRGRMSMGTMCFFVKAAGRPFTGRHTPTRSHCVPTNEGDKNGWDKNPPAFEVPGVR